MMEKEPKRKVRPLTPEKLTGLIQKSPPAYAAGLSAVKVAMEHAMSEMGPLRAIKTLSRMNQRAGFDCPGCAWPDPDGKRSSLGEYCENGAKALAEEATLKRVDPEFFAAHSVEALSGWSDYEIGRSGRITHPMVLPPGKVHYEPISWEGAFTLIAQHLQALDDPNEAIFYTSGRSSNEAAFLYALFARAFGTNNLPDCSNMCHESSGVALKQTLGIGKGSVTLDDLHRAEVVIVIGQNPGTNHPRMLSALQRCKEAGGKVIAINPLKEAGLKRFVNPQKISHVLGKGTEITDLFLQVRINEDVALLKALIKALHEEDRQAGNVWDHGFIREHTQGYEALVKDLASHDLATLLARCGVSLEEIQAAVALLAPARRIIICWAMGLTQHKNAVDNIRECVNLLLLKGSIGKPGAGTCPVRGHSNVQGDRTVGIVSKPTAAMNEALEREMGFTPPAAAGHDLVHSLMAMHAGRAKIFVALGGNVLSAASDTLFTAEALQRCDLTVSISTKLNRTHLIPGKTALILPTLGRSEADLHQGKARKVTVENSMGKVHPSQGKLPPASEHLLSEPVIVARMAHATLGNAVPVDWLALGEDYALIREKISRVVQGFEAYNTRIEQPGGFYLPNHARNGDFSSLPHGRAQLSICPLPEHDLAPGEFLLMSIRSHDQFNTTIYGLHDRYRGIFNERRVLFMHPEDMAAHALEPKSLVDISSHYDGKVRTAPMFHVVPYDIPRGNLACYFPEANVLVPIDRFADHSHTPISKSVKVRITRRS